MDYNRIYSLIIFLSFFYFASTTLSIIELKVPESIKSGSTDEIVLDCNYEASGDEHSVVVKWFYNGQVEQIYQWIPGYQKHGYPMGKLKDRIDINYQPDNETESYRAIKIKNITPDLSGNYTCKVSSDLNEDYKTKQLIIYDPADDGLHTFLMENESLIVCSASGLYPKPNLELFVSEGNETVDENDIIEDLDIDENGFYNITKSLYFNFSSSVTFTCELSIPGTNYSEMKAVEYYFEIDDIETQLQSVDDLYLNYIFNSSIFNSNQFNITLNDTEEFIDNVAHKENSASRQIPSTTSLVTSLLMILLMFIAK